MLRQLLVFLGSIAVVLLLQQYDHYVEAAFKQVQNDKSNTVRMYGD